MKMFKSAKQLGINNRFTRNQAGASLFEALMFIVVGALVIAGVVGMGVKVFGSQTESRVNEQVTEIATGIRSVFAGQPNFGTASSNLLATLSAAQALPADLATAGTGAAMTAAGGYGAVAVAVGAINTQYTVTLSTVPAEACIKIAGKTQAGWVSLKVGTAAAVTAFPYPTATAVTDCGNTGTTTMVFTGK